MPQHAHALWSCLTWQTLVWFQIILKSTQKILSLDKPDTYTFSYTAHRKMENSPSKSKKWVKLFSAKAVPNYGRTSPNMGPWDISLCICKCFWGGKALEHTYNWTPGAVERSGEQHDVAATLQPRKAVVRHLLAKEHFTQMGNSLQRVPTCKTYNPRRKQRTEITNGLVSPALQTRSIIKQKWKHFVSGKPH